MDNFLEKTLPELTLVERESLKDQFSIEEIQLLKS